MGKVVDKLLGYPRKPKDKGAAIGALMNKINKRRGVAKRFGGK